MALPNSAVWEIRPGSGSDNNGGGFDSAKSGTDYSQQNSAQYSFTDLASTNGTNSSPAVTSASHSFVSADVGNFVNITAGTNWTAGIYEILSVATGAATLDRACGSSATLSGGTWAEGGALATLGKLISNVTRGNIAWCKAATISQGSKLTLPDANSPTALIGYTTTRGDNGQVTIQATSSLNDNLLTVGRSWILRNFIIDCNNKGPGAGTAGISALTNSQIIHCQIINQNAFYGISCNGNNVTCIDCSVTASGGIYAAFLVNGAVGATFVNCVASGNTFPGFQTTIGTANSAYTCIGCIAANNSGASSDGFYAAPNNTGATFINCLAYGNGRDGFQWSPATGGSSSVTMQGCISYGNAGYGINQVANSGFTVQNGTYFLDFNAYGGNTANLNNVPAGPHDVTLTGDPTTAGASNDFSLNSTSGAGAACRTAGFPGTLQSGGTGFADIGPLQHQATGSTTYVITRNTTIFQGDT